ncbi:activating transcription factor 7-interacting protein 1 [Megalops cyprinoides]|uniref:activating transcription factor 7-interacting protein 1 n=1 Tax=Megalops cyprinoides TaxID=118141 RepID=UPI0018640F84|nr:activating transcription factor 7-interacting protein 1 [Megalops cyprinoides]
MDLAVPDEPQKKVFRARKTMKMSDRQQLEFLHNSQSSFTLRSSSSSASSSPAPPPLVNGKHPEEGRAKTEKVREAHANRNAKGKQSTSPVTRSRSPQTLSLSLSPTPPPQTPRLRSRSLPPSSRSLPAKSAGKESEEQERKGGEGNVSSLMKGGKTKDEVKTKGREAKGNEGTAEDREHDLPEPHGNLSSSQDSPQDRTASPVSSQTAEGRDEEKKIEADKNLKSEETVAMDTGPAPMETEALEDSKPTSEDTSIPVVNTTTSCCPSSPSKPSKPDQEVKEGFLVLSEEDDNQGGTEKAKDKEEVEENQDGEKMEVDTEQGDKTDVSPLSNTTSPTSPTSAGTAGLEKCAIFPSAKKRALCKDVETDGQREGEEEGGTAREGKRQKVEGEELEAQLELKIRADASTRLKLEKVVQQLVEEQLRVLQLSVFDRTLQELKERVEKIDCATKHQQTLNTLQAKITRLAKKFGAANQAKENIRKPQEMMSPPSAANATSPMSTTPTFRLGPSSSRQTNHNPAPHPVSSTASPCQSKTLPTPAPLTPTAPAPLLSIIPTSTASSSTASVSNLAPTPSQNQTGTLLLKTTPAGNVVTQSTPTPVSQPVPLQPLLIQLPLTVANSQGGALMTNHSPGVELIPVSSLSTVNTLSKAKTTTPATTLILQKPAPSSSAPALPPSPSLPQVTLARAVYSGGGGAVSVPSSGVSVSTARTPTQCVSVVGVTSSASLPASSVPAATGGQSTGSAGSGPPTLTMMASKTDNQPTNSATNTTPAQVSCTSSSGAVIDLTEDDDDVQVTGVRKAPVHTAAPSAFSSSPSAASSSATQRGAGPPPPLISSTTTHGPATGATMRLSPQSGPHSVNGPQLTVHYRPPQDSPSKPRAANINTGTPTSIPHPLVHQPPPLPSPPPPPARLPPEAAHTSPPQQPQLKLARVQSQNGIVLSWSVEEADRTCAAVDSYHLYAYHQDHSGPAGSASTQSQWKKIGEVKALPLPMACTLTQFVSGSTYYFAVCARDVYSRFGPFCEPQCTDVISNLSS